MPEQFIIEGGHKLNGTMEASGNKNAALKLIPACLLTDEPVILRNVPDIGDVRVMCDILRSIGVAVEWQPDGGLRIHAKTIRTHKVDPQLTQKIRASIVLSGPMLARLGAIDLGSPGGDVIGRRRLDTHVLALQQLGATIDFSSRFVMNAD